MKKVLFLYLNAFSVTGGIEKFNCSVMKALHDLGTDGFVDADAFSMYDDNTPNEKYFSQNKFKGFAGNRLLFVLYSIWASFRYNVVIIGHINLSLVGVIIKLVRPKTKLVLIAHGFEVWESQKAIKKRMLKIADSIWAVSHFTKDKMIETNAFLVADKIHVFPNTIDFYFQIPDVIQKPSYLLDRYNISANQKVLLTITRLSSLEKYKGYDVVLQALSEKMDQALVYILGGKADEEEKKRVEMLIEQNGVQDKVKLIGYIKDEELTDHYLLADTFIMPSKKEGFGIVFIEAMACGCKVIAGNKDGSTEALQHGRLGTLIDPDNPAEIRTALQQALADEHHQTEQMQKQVLETFGFPIFKNRLKEYLRL